MIDTVYDLAILALLWRIGSWGRKATKETRGLRAELAAERLDHIPLRQALVRGTRGQG
jgi:hypothetical protein